MRARAGRPPARAACCCSSCLPARWPARARSAAAQLSTLHLPHPPPAGPNPLTYFLSSVLGCTQYTGGCMGGRVHGRAGGRRRAPQRAWRLAWVGTDHGEDHTRATLDPPHQFNANQPTTNTPHHRPPAAFFIAKELKLPSLGRAAWTAAADFDVRGLRGLSPDYDARFQKLVVSQACARASLASPASFPAAGPAAACTPLPWRHGTRLPAPPCPRLTSLAHLLAH